MILPLLLAASPASAQDGAINFLVLVRDEAGQLSEGAELRAGGALVTLRDDGAPPDPQAGDGGWTAAIEGASAGEIPLTITSGGAEIWSETVELDASVSMPSLNVTLGRGGASWQVLSDARFDLVVIDEGGLLAAPLRLQVGDPERWSQDVPLRDDGAPPDPQAGDGRYAALILRYPAPAAAVSLFDAAGEVVWSGEVEVGQGYKEPVFTLTIGPDGVRTDLSENASGGAASSDAPGAGSSASPSPAPASSAASAARTGGGALPALPFGGGLGLGLLLGALGSWLAWGRSSGMTLLRPGAPALDLSPLPTPGDPPAQIWIVPDAEARRRVVIALAALAPGAALIAPTAASRPALRAGLDGRPAACWLRQDHPEVDQLIEAAAAIPGLSLIVVEGPDALEPPEEKEPPEAVIEELIEVSTTPTLILLIDGEVAPIAPALRLQEPAPVEALLDRRA